ncbi:maleylpyruvate isomerase N-terminal domain-containing protein [Streptomyces nogalater]
MTTEFPSRQARTLRAAYGAASAVVAGLGDEESWQPTGCTGWAVRDLVFHCVGDAQRALVALHTPTEEPAARDWVTYWQGWRPDTAGAANGRRWARVNGSMFLDFGQLKDLYLETLAAVVHAAGTADPARRVLTQGHVLTAGDLITTLVVEATIHHLDLTVALPHAPGPSPRGWPRCAPPSTGCSVGPACRSGATPTTRAWAPAGPRSPTPNAPPWARRPTASHCSAEPDHREARNPRPVSPSTPDTRLTPPRAPLVRPSRHAPGTADLPRHAPRAPGPRHPLRTAGPPTACPGHPIHPHHPHRTPEPSRHMPRTPGPPAPPRTPKPSRHAPRTADSPRHAPRTADSPRQALRTANSFRRRLRSAGGIGAAASSGSLAALPVAVWRTGRAWCGVRRVGAAARRGRVAFRTLKASDSGRSAAGGREP